MLDSYIGPAFMIVLGLVFALHGLCQLIEAYRPRPLDEWMETALPAAGAVMLGALLAWSGYQLGSRV